MMTTTSISLQTMLVTTAMAKPGMEMMMVVVVTEVEAQRKRA
jgi:hypothetical protein